MTQSVKSSGSIPAQRRTPSTFASLRQTITRKRELTEAMAQEEILGRLDSRRAHWYRVIGRKLPERYVEDVYGQVCLQIAEDFEKHDASTVKDVDGYIAKVCIRCASDKLRRHTTEAKALQNGKAQTAMGHPQAVNDHDNVVARERYLIVRNVMAEVLTERQHLIYVLRHVKDLNSPEIGAALDISAVLARKELSAAQKALDRKEVKQRLRSLLHEER
ncbi:hypothetical protein GCM10010306_021610 [Streptomyces umbrinus]|uniref:RNA polymerase sigma factor n=1 Tax=Streptomyces umbrinus TaxID=67370 RepID=UPI00167AC7C2|nr:sigma-70 family RNA polymerase sigma factor [Streptomyces umbrinus]GHB28883.1 hypothetical protein GCM10010306_021610 [Streptomyces umbrinus]